MSRFFDFSGREKLERTIEETWVDFRTDLTKKRFGYQEVGKALKCIFLKVYDDVFYKNRGFEFNTTMVDELKDLTIRRQELPTREKSTAR